MQEKVLLELKKQIVEQATIVEKMIEKSMSGLLDKNKEKLEEVLNIDEDKVNQLEIDISKRCTIDIASFQPMAKDLRIILMSYEMTHDLERMGDLAVNIAESALFLIERPFIEHLEKLQVMAEETRTMVKESIDAVINEDEHLAKKVLKNDDVVDNLQKEIREYVSGLMKKDSSYIERGLHIIRVAHNLERIADHSTNICEEALFIAKGKVVMHHANGDSIENE